MNWLWWTLLGICTFAVVLFCISCAWLSHYLDVHEDDKEDWF